MKITSQIRINESMKPGDTEIASGWVEIEDCIKFPVKVRKYMDTREQKEKMFVSYPQRKTGQGYAHVLYPDDPQVKKEIEAHVMESISRTLAKGVHTVPVTNVRVTMLDQENSAAPRIKGIASIQAAGITINGIMVKEGERGLFVQMPQHKSGGAWKDTVYGTNSSMQYQIQEAVLGAYRREQKQAEEKGMEKAPGKDAKKRQQEQTPHGPKL